LDRADAWKIRIEHSKSARPRLEVRSWGILVSLPEGVSEEEAYRIIERHGSWIAARRAELLEALKRAEGVRLVERSREEFRKLVLELVERSARELLGVNPFRVVVRTMRTRWASCSPQGVITVNSLARHLPDHLVKYIVQHELCHAVELRHGEAFWACVKKLCPDYEELEKELLAYEVKLGLHGPQQDNR